MSSLLDDMTPADPPTIPRSYASVAAAAALFLAGLLRAGELELSPGQRPLERALRGGQEHAFTLALRTGQLLSLEVVQKGIDVVVEVRDPQGQTRLQADSPSGTSGPEPALFVAEATGKHTIVVRALEPDAEPGRFAVARVEVRDALPRDREMAEAMRLVGESYALRERMRQAQALPLAERALGLREKALGTDDPAVADALTLLGYLYDEVGDYRRGEQAFARALDIVQRRLPGDDPAVVGTTSNLGHLRLALGDYDGAEALFLTALAARERRGGPLDSPLQGLSLVSAERGELARAREYRGRVRERQETAGNLAALGALSLASGQLEDAARLCEQARRKAEGGSGFAPWTVASSLECLGLSRFARGQAAEAEADLRRSLRVREEVSGPDHPFVASSLTALARVLAAKDPAEARALLERALRIRERWLLPSNRLIADTLKARGDLERAAGRAAEAEAEYRRALSIYETSAPKHPDREAVRRALEALGCPGS
jgi:tetratricopeptide (TPR) repeat protein